MLDELYELIKIPELRASMEAQLNRAKKLYSREIEEFYKAKVKAIIGDNSDKKYFRLKKSSGMDGMNSNEWAVVVENGNDIKGIFTAPFINFLTSFGVDPEKPITQKFLTIDNTIDVEFVRWDIDLIIGQIGWKANKDVNKIKVVESFEWRKLPREIQIEMFWDTFHSNKDIQSDVLDHFFTITFPYLGQKVI